MEVKFSRTFAVKSKDDEIVVDFVESIKRLSQFASIVFKQHCEFLTEAKEGYNNKVSLNVPNGALFDFTSFVDENGCYMTVGAWFEVDKNGSIPTGMGDFLITTKLTQVY